MPRTEKSAKRQPSSQSSSKKSKSASKKQSMQQQQPPTGYPKLPPERTKGRSMEASSSSSRQRS